MNTFCTFVPARSAALTCALGCAALIAPAAAAQAGEGGGWQYEVTPYLWAAGLDGTIRIDNRPQAGLGVQQTFSDVLERLDFGFMGAIEARNGRWGILFDGLYFRVKDVGSVSGRLGFTSLTGRGTVTQQQYSLAGAYRVSDGPRLVDVIGGLRLNSVSWDVTIDASVPVVPVAGRQFEQSKRWTDPFIGARVQLPLGDRWTLVGYGDIGGFGVGSDLSWQALIGANYAFTPTIIGKVGYRHVSVDYDKRDFTYDMASSGPYLGLGIRW
jgi:opacity protein-like surface antigen